MKIKKTERGWPGHFICASDCTFRRNTLVQYGQKYIVVSTVGNMIRNNVPEEIGYDRFYETMAFRSVVGDSIYHDADVSKQVYAEDAKWAISKREIEENKDSIDNIANKMHEDYVAKIEELLINKTL